MPGSNRDFRLDSKSRTAWQLAWHLGSSDVQMLDEIADHKFDMAMTPEQLTTPVDFAGVFKMPAFFYLGFVNNHSVHHRGQLAAYLRPMGSKVPSIYGGSDDEPWNG